jgi:hypothetical protein
MRIALAINKNHPNHNTFLAFLSQFTVLDSELSVDIVSYDNLEQIYNLVNKKCAYVLIMPRYCFIDINKLYNWIISKKPNIAGLSSHKGIGYPYFLLCRTSFIKPLSKLMALSPKDSTENYFMNLIQRLMLDRNYDSYKEGKILALDSMCYLANCNYTTGVFHKSIFVSLSDMDKNFVTTMGMLSSGIKEVYYNKQLYKLKIGKSFFIYKYWNFAILPDHTVLVWSAIKNDWIVANKRQNQILQQIL